MPTFNFTVDVPTGQRIAAAFGLHLGAVDANGLARPATAAEVKQWLIAQVKKVVAEQERQVEINKINLADVTAV